MPPELSIVIPSYNRSDRLHACLDALTRQTQPVSDFEVIVVLDGSTDGSEQMLEAMSPPFALRVVRQENRGNGAARNHGAEVASGRYLLFLDDDIVASPELVSEHVRVQRQHGGAVVIGPALKLLPRRPSRFTRFAAKARLEHFRSLEVRPATFVDCWSFNLSVPRVEFWGAGGFATDLPREVDTEFGYRLEVRGVPFVFAPRAEAREDDRETARERIADAELRGKLSLELWRRHPPMISWMELGGHWELPRRWLALRRMLLGLHFPPLLLYLFGNLLPRCSWLLAWNRFRYSYCLWRGVRKAVPDRDTWRRLTNGTPILMYHAICAPGERASTYGLPVHRFERQMRWLKRRGYNVIGLEELVTCRLEHRLPPAKSIVLTFDDGYADNRELAAPILERLGFAATFFLVTEGGDRATWSTDAALAGRPLMSLDQARELVGGVIRFGAHTRNHRDLTSLAPDEVEAEVAGSRGELEAALGVPITMFAYPYGRLSPEIKEIVRHAGFLAACSVESGRNRLAVDPYMLKRLEVRGTDSLLRFALTLWIGQTRSLFSRLLR